MMTKAYSIAFKQKMVERLTGKHAVNSSQLAREIGVRQQNLSRWLHEARSLPLVASNTPKVRVWTVEQKAQVIADASKLSGEQLTSYLEREGIKLADFERWRIALEEDGQGSIAQRTRHLPTPVSCHGRLEPAHRRLEDRRPRVSGACGRVYY